MNRIDKQPAAAWWGESDAFTAFRYESPIAPSVEVFQESAVEAFPIAIVGFAVAFSVAKVYSIKHDYTIDGNQVSYINNTVPVWICYSGEVKLIWGLVILGWISGLLLCMSKKVGPKLNQTKAKISNG